MGRTFGLECLSCLLYLEKPLPIHHFWDQILFTSKSYSNSHNRHLSQLWLSLALWPRLWAVQKDRKWLEILDLVLPVHAKSLQSCLAVCDPMDCSPPGSSVPGILQARILEWAAMPSCMESSGPRDWTHVSYISCIGRWFLYHWCHLGSPFLTTLVLYAL